jgi:protein fantom
LNDIAYGTRQVKVTPDLGDKKSGRRGSFSFVGTPSIDMLDHNLIANLERGQNIFEIHLTKLTLSDEAIRILNETDPSTFCTIEFFEHELQTTPVVQGRKPEFNFTSQYIVKVDDFFLHYLQKETTTIELHQAIGSDYTTKAACQISFRELIDKQTPRLHGAASLLCVSGNNMGVSFGTIEYWARLIVPVDEAFRLYKERTKALGYLSTNRKAANQHENQQKNKESSANNMNELKINVLRCAKLNLDNKQTQPSPYCVYRFYDFNDHDTEIIASSNYPEFNDHKSFAVPMDMDLDKYLKKEFLEIYVFDDNELESSGLYLGMAKIPLISLAHDNDIKGTFELKQVYYHYYLLIFNKKINFKI